ncbi:protein B4 [Dunckerocampus dactyliophorus]|uniref:protein B4 n=1 Tax=Dunckerocampus dactyliophorus TaxID=161453 RepID=UPI002405C273|nr:protein B4 [Dunckerocampus dactyliophorus]
MPPKKNSTVVDEKASSSNAPVLKKMGPVTVRKMSAHPPTLIMVREALIELDSRKGVSLQAIQNFIKRNYPSVDHVRVKHFVRRAIKKGLETGILVRPAHATVAVGVMGRFRLAPKTKESKPKAPKVKENVDPNVQKAAKEETKKIKTDNGATKKAAANKPKKEESKVPKRSKKDEVLPATKVVPAKKPKAKKAADKEEDEEAASSVKAKAKPKEAKLKEPKEAKPKKVKEAKAAKGKAAKGSKDPAPKAPAKGGRKKNTE